ncbi:hypothetical protein G6F57_020681 [Rhizopus arrhizus]|nr:hypothetical protein G6F57_020681 [Rhizopus arrhizus]
MSASSAGSAYMTEPWHLLMTWGVFSGISSGAVASVLGATIVNRWFTKHRGLVMGLLTASTASGTLVFLPVLATLASSGDWTRVVWTVAAAAAALEIPAQGLRRAVVVASPADRPPLARLHGAYRATAIAEWFRDQGLNVLLLMDSLTRFAQAQREIGLSVGEPPTTRGYPPAAARSPRSTRC